MSASRVAVRSTDGPSATVIDGGGTKPCCSVDLSVDSSSASFEGFTLVNGSGRTLSGGNACGGGALYVTLSRCVVSNCTAEIGGGAYGCTLYDCLLAGDGGFHSHADYERAANGTKTTPGGAPMAVWQDWVAGTCPTNPASVFLADIAVSNGVPVVSWTPDLGAARDYAVLGKSNLLDRTWGPTNAASRFFRVEVRAK